MPNPDQQTNITAAISAIRSAEDALTTQIRATSDALVAIKLTHEFNNLDSYLSQLLHAQNAADDAAFTDATKALQTQATGLKAAEASIQAVVKDVATAATIVGYITQALAFIAKL